MSRKEEAVPRRTAAAPIPTSLGESLDMGSGGSVLTERQESIRNLIPRKDGFYSQAVNKSLRDLDSKLLSFKYEAHDLDIIEAYVKSEAKRWEKERSRRENYARWSNSLYGNKLNP